MEFTARSPAAVGPADYAAECKWAAVPDMDPRGGATLTAVDGKLLVFGGADRQQRHFNDLWALQPGAAEWTKIHCTGDVPMTRSGHSAVAFGRYLLLFGGIDFAEGVAYNDLYALDSANWEWSYVGEAGEEIPVRNSHTSGIVREPNSGDNYLVVFGGASPEHGPLGDTYAAKLPKLEEIGDIKELYVTWRKVTGAVDGTHPGKREMQAGCVCGDSLYITGGRSLSGEVLSDTWRLSFPCDGAAAQSLESEPSSESNEASQESDVAAAAGAPVVVDITKSFGRHTEGDVHSEPVGRSVGVDPSPSATPGLTSLCWQPCRDLQLIGPLCSHVAAATADGFIVLYGGFTGTGIAETLQYVDIAGRSGDAIGCGWQRGAGTAVEPRFGASLCPAPAEWAASGVVLFGGVNAEKDCSDVWLLK